MRELTRFSAEVKAELLALVVRTQERTGWTVRRILHHLGLSKARYRDWTRRAATATLADRRPVAPMRDGILTEEKEAVIAYALAHPKEGYRRLTWQMVDADVAYLSESSVYRVLRDADLLARWKRHGSVGTAPRKPMHPHERWHTDLMYLRIADTWYFLVTVIDAYSRYVVHWELLTTMTAADVRLVIQQALEHTAGRDGQRRAVHRGRVQGSGPALRAGAYPDSDLSSRIERRGRAVSSFDAGGAGRSGHPQPRASASDHREVVQHYNEERLHAGLGYLTPAEFYRGNPAARLEERRAKLEKAQRERQRINDKRLKEAA